MPELRRTLRRVAVVYSVMQPYLLHRGIRVSGIPAAKVQRGRYLRTVRTPGRDGASAVTRSGRAVPSPSLSMVTNLTPVEIRDALATRSDVLLVDVREPAEHATARIDGALLIPLRTVPQSLEQLPRDKEIILHCHHGMRSEMAGNFLVAQGYPRVSHMVGGIDRWSDDVDSAVAKY